MKKFILSVLIGSITGSLLALGILFIAPQLPQIFATAFFTKAKQAPVVIVKDIQNIFSPATNQYIIGSVDQTIASSSKVVYADLGLMKITTYEQGQKVAEYPIRSVGREGTAWQTPIGKFDMSYKSVNHFSSIGHVWMPFSMHFFGNYFIHGWPYYEGGMPVAEGYSGGCIRLNTPDAEQIYAFVDKNTELVITTSNKNPIEQKTDFEYKIKESAPPLEGKYLVADIETGEVVAAQGAQEQIQIDSFAKLMTGLISLETLNQYQEAVLNQDIVKISDVLYALLMQDDNNAGDVLYAHKNKPQYLLDMNTRAQSLDMKQTKYLDTNGTSLGTVSSLEDTFKLIQYIQSYKPFLIKVLSLDSYTIGQSTQDAIHPLHTNDLYIAGFSNTKQDQMATLVSLDIHSSDAVTVEKKKFLILVHGDSYAAQDTQALQDWITRSVQLR